MMATKTNKQKDVHQRNARQDDACTHTHTHTHTKQENKKKILQKAACAPRAESWDTNHTSETRRGWGREEEGEMKTVLACTALDGIKEQQSAKTD
jgi:hypothetical protein